MEGRTGFLEISVINHESYLTYIYIQTERCCFTCYISLTFLAYFVLSEENFKISKIAYFSFTFKLNEKKKVPLKTFVWRGGMHYS